MAPLSLDLDAQIESLRGLKTDLDEHYWTLADGGDDAVRYAFGMAVAQLAQRIGALEEIVRHHGGDEVTFPHLTSEESRALGRALELLDGEFVADPHAPQAELWTRVRTLLAAARGSRAQALDHDRGPRLGVVLPLARSGR
jgi:hypothetical protein